MSPSVSENTVQVQEATDSIGKLSLNPKQDDGPAYPLYLPHYDVNEKFPPTEIFEFFDRGTRADPAKPHLLGADTKVSHISPFIGTEITGVQISQLSEGGFDELALYAAERKVLVFRDQDFKDIGPDRQIEIAKRFGYVQRHPTSPNVKGYPEFHIVYRDPQHDRLSFIIPSDCAIRTRWHVDGSYEKQTPGTTFFWILDQPDVGGDTIFASTVEAYNRLSPEFQKRLEGLRATHSSVGQAETSRKLGRPVRQEPIVTEHPIVRRHPVTGEKAIYVNPAFTQHIVGYKVEESQMLLKFLHDHIAKGADFQIRATYKPGTVVVWDNRVTIHAATGDYDIGVRRHAARLTPQAEIPIPA
ncbi:hypothetical protein BJ138DRAFT_1156041 [Hygrophoropsis aurantiaca]|uniref:Uncharacterized protein n=1 Tax=Hygrophoropsis aurantiaca TaxID=72124 RepID=A0ACB8A7T4_9AGAM|nr:hypothetical protein BJ138DRAFT_1156041 [Hygrophoropsis aurantiaca]